VIPHPLVDYFRCPEHLAVLGTADHLPPESGYFRFGDIVCYGCQGVGEPSERPDGALVDVSDGVEASDGKVVVPFNLDQVLDNLRYERYPEARRAIEHTTGFSPTHAAYYLIRPLLPVAVRKHLQRMHWAGWQSIAFPRWPGDTAVETLMRQAAGLVLARAGVRELPFVWFWPDGAPGCAMMTHDVEGFTGAAFCGELMDLDAQYGIRSSFQVIPDGPRMAKFGSRELVAQLQRRGFEANVHDLSHDGRLFRSRDRFLRHAATINAHGRQFGSRGFRAGAMYRRQDWFAALDIAYDMSVPNVAHLEPQAGGCCTVMPYFLGHVLELPLTASQDYTMFHILGDYSTTLWQEQIDRILAEHGLISFIAHPDYLIEDRAREVYTELLRMLAALRDERHVWMAPPAEIDRWWRERHEMRLVADGESWRIEGPGSERARIAYARLDGDRVVYDVDRTERVIDPAKREGDSADREGDLAKREDDRNVRRDGGRGFSPDVPS
jgi:hypothetical protein